MLEAAEELSFELFCYVGSALLECSSQDRCRGQRQLRGSICLLQTSLLHMMPDR